MNFLSLFLLTALLPTQDPKVYSLSDLKQPETPVIWIGLDYSQSRMVGRGSFGDPYQLHVYFAAWNAFVYKEPDKYDLQKAFRANHIKIDLEVVAKRNALVNPDKILSDASHSLEQPQIDSAVKAYDFGSRKEGIGVAMVVESYDRYAEKGNYYLVIFDIASRGILYQEKISTDPMGFGLRNYWARTFYNSLKYIENKSSYAWK